MTSQFYLEETPVEVKGAEVSCLLSQQFCPYISGLTNVKTWYSLSHGKYTQRPESANSP